MFFRNLKFIFFTCSFLLSSLWWAEYLNMTQLTLNCCWMWLDQTTVPPVESDQVRVICPAGENPQDHCWLKAGQGGVVLGAEVGTGAVIVHPCPPGDLKTFFSTRGLLIHSSSPEETWPCLPWPAKGVENRDLCNTLNHLELWPPEVQRPGLCCPPWWFSGLYCKQSWWAGSGAWEWAEMTVEQEKGPQHGRQTQWAGGY